MRRALLLAPLLFATAVVVWTGIRVREAPERRVVAIVGTGADRTFLWLKPVDPLARISERLGIDLGGRFALVGVSRGEYRWWEE